MFKTEGGMLTDDGLVTDLQSVVDKITQPTAPFVWVFPKHVKVKFNARKWTNKALIEFAIDSIYGECQDRCIGDCHCSEIAALIKRRFKNV
jgi:hypothetical protein